jgi:acetate---CoA ligase (ADP-forming)
MTHHDTSNPPAADSAPASLRPLLSPHSIVVIGANRERGKIGSELLHNLISSGYKGRLFVVHPTATRIDGVPTHQTVGAIGEPIDLAVIAVPAHHVLVIVDECVTAGVKAAVVITAGFSEIGGAGRILETELLRRVRRGGIRLVGPNCMGIINMDPTVQMNATFAPIAPRPGRVALSTQSGALGFAILDYARQLHIGFSTFVSVGNRADVSSNDLLEYWAQDPSTDVILLYLESFGNPRNFTQIARRVARVKPIIAVKAGRSRSGARAASSHTGALAASDAIVDALFHHAGVIRTNTLEELFDVTALLANQPVPRGRRVAVLTNAGGPGILAADMCEACGLILPALSDHSREALGALLPATASLANPVDMIASATAAQYEGALATLLGDDGIDSVLVIFIPPLVTAAEDMAAAIERATAAHPGKTVLAVCMSTAATPVAFTSVPSFRFPEAASIALARAAAYGEWRARPEGAPVAFHDLDRDAARRIVDEARARGGGWLTPDEAQALLSSVRIPLAQGATVASEDDAVREADRMGYPVVLKAVGPDIVHKTEVGGLRLHLDTAVDVRTAWGDLKTRLGNRMQEGLVQQMISGGVEILAGVFDDATFGHVVVCASGGTMTELVADRQLRLHPLTNSDAHDMVSHLRSAALLRGYRGAPPADEAALCDALLRLSALVTVCPEIRELDINPLLVLSSGTCALDVRIAVEPPDGKPVASVRGYLRIASILHLPDPTAAK